MEKRASGRSPPRTVSNITTSSEDDAGSVQRFGSTASGGEGSDFPPLPPTDSAPPSRLTTPEAERGRSKTVSTTDGAKRSKWGMVVPRLHEMLPPREGAPARRTRMPLLTRMASRVLHGRKDIHTVLSGLHGARESGDVDSCVVLLRHLGKLLTDDASNAFVLVNSFEFGEFLSFSSFNVLEVQREFARCMELVCRNEGTIQMVIQKLMEGNGNLGVFVAAAHMEDVETQSYCAKCLTFIAGNPDGPSIVDELHCFELLFSMAETSDPTLRLEIARALSDLVDNYDYPLRMARIGACARLASFCNGTTSAEVRKIILSVLIRLGTYEPNIPLFSKSGVQAIVSMLKAAQFVSRRRATLAVGAGVARLEQSYTFIVSLLDAIDTLSANTTLKRAFGCSSMFHQFGRLAKLRETDIHGKTAATLNNLLELRGNQHVFVKEDEHVEWLQYLVSVDDTTIKRNVSLCVENLSLMPDNGAHFVARNGLQLVVPLSENPEEDVREPAIRAFGNLTAHPSNYRPILKHAMNTWHVLTVSESEPVIFEAARIIANLSEIEECVPNLADRFILRGIFKLTLSTNERVQEMAMKALKNVAVNVQNKVKIVTEDGFSTLYKLLERPNEDIQLKAMEIIDLLLSAVENQVALVETDGCPLILRALDAEWDDMRLATMHAISHISGNETLRHHFTQMPCLRKLVMALASPNSDFLIESCHILTNLATDDELQKAIVESGALKRLFELVRDKNPLVGAQAIRTLAALSVHEVNRSAMIEKDIIGDLVERVRHPESEHLAACVLERLSTSPCWRGDLHRAGLVDVSLDLLTSRNNDVVCRGASLVYNLGQEAFIVDDFLRKGAMDSLIDIFSKHFNVEVVYQALRAFAVLCKDDRGARAASRDHAATKRVLELAFSRDPSVQLEACRTFANMTCQNEGRRALENADGLRALVRLTSSENTDTVLEVTRTIANMAETGGGPRTSTGPLTSRLSGKEEEAEIEARDDRLRLELKANGCLKALLKLARSTSPGVKKEVARALGNLSLNVDCAEFILRANGLPVLMSLSRMTGSLRDEAIEAFMRVVPRLERSPMWYVTMERVRLYRNLYSRKRQVVPITWEASMADFSAEKDLRDMNVEMESESRKKFVPVSPPSGTG